jgi:hypothetical protein
MKMFWFFTASTEIPLAFKLCGIFQACCDAYLGWQYWSYGSGESRFTDNNVQLASLGSLSRPRTAGGLGTSLKEKDERFE